MYLMGRFLSKIKETTVVRIITVIECIWQIAFRIKLLIRIMCVQDQTTTIVICLSIDHYCFISNTINIIFI